MSLTERQDFTGRELARSNETAITAAAAQAKAMVEARFVMAMQRPRDMIAVRERLLREADRRGFAEVARYQIPRGGNTISGPSIRFAEAAARALGNLHVDQVVVFEDDEKRVVKVTVIDLESNMSYDQSFVVMKLVERRKLRRGETALAERVGSEGQTVFIVEASEGDVAQKQQAAASKAIRNCVLRILPGDLLDEALAHCDETLRKQDTRDPAAAAKRLADAFAGLGITVGMLAEFLGHPIDKTTPDELEELRPIYSAIKDGETTWGDVVEARAAEGEKRRSRTKGTKENKERAALLESLAAMRLDDSRREALELALGGMDLPGDQPLEQLPLEQLQELAQTLQLEV